MIYIGKVFLKFSEAIFPDEIHQLIFESDLLKREKDSKKELKPKPSLVVPTENDYENKKFKGKQIVTNKSNNVTLFE